MCRWPSAALRHSDSVGLGWSPRICMSEFSGDAGNVIIRNDIVRTTAYYVCVGTHTHMNIYIHMYICA